MIFISILILKVQIDLVGCCRQSVDGRFRYGRASAFPATRSSSHFRKFSILTRNATQMK